MATASDSGDASEIFWPGYVDAVTNLAINLLFVIAVMSIVVLAATLQISQMTKVKSTQPDVPPAGSSAPVPVQSTSSERSTNQDAGALLRALSEVQTKLEATEKQLAQAKKQLDEKQVTDKQAVQTQKQPGQQPMAASQTVEANDIKASQTRSPGRVQTVSPAALVVVFSPDVVSLSAAESAEITGKFKTIAPNGGGRWKITVISPKGFSESSRLAYYRAQAVRTTLLEHGVPASLIDLQINESEKTTADDSKVFVQWQQ